MDNRIRRSKRVCCCLACWCCAITRDEKEREREKKAKKTRECEKKKKKENRGSWNLRPLLTRLSDELKEISILIFSIGWREKFCFGFLLAHLLLFFFPFLSFFDFIISGFYRAPVLLPGRWWLKAAAQTPRRIIYMASAIERYALTN